MSNSRLTASLAALAICATAIFAAGCGGSSNSTSGGTEASGGEALTVGSDIPIPPSSRANPVTTPASTSK